MSDLLGKIDEQQRLAQLIRDTQAQERELRAEILEECFGLDQVGTHKTAVGNLIVTGDYGLTYKFNQAELDEAIKCGGLTDACLNAINVKYDLDKKAYKNLGEDDTAIIEAFLTITPALPTLKIKADEE